MKPKKLLALFALSVLVFSMIQHTAIGQNTPSTLFETGDEFEFVGGSSFETTESSNFQLSNSSNSAQIYRIHENSRSSTQDSDDNMRIQIIRDVGETPYGYIDTLALSERESYYAQDSYTEEWNEFDSNRAPGDKWHNDTQFDDFSGSTDHSRDTTPLNSNTTYAVIPPEMEFSTTPAPFWIPYIDQSTIPLPIEPDANLLWRNVTSGSGIYTINGNDFTLNTYNVTQKFSYSIIDEFTFPIQMEGTPDTVNLNGTLSVTIDFYYELIFDQSNGMVLEISDTRDVYANLQGIAANITHTPPGSPQSIEIDIVQNNNLNEHSESHVKLTSVSNLYGNSRPSSSGDNRLMEGDTLEFDNSGEFDLTVSSPITGSIDSSGSLSGTTNLNVFYHEPGFFKAVYRVENMPASAVPYQSESPPDDGMFEIGIVESPSNDSYEIQPFYEDRFYMDIPIPDLNNQGGMMLNDHDGFPYYYLIPDGIPQTDVKQYQEFMTYEINGFEYVVDALVIEVLYSFSDTFTEYVEEFNSDADISVSAEASSKFIYDSDTGVLLEVVDHAQLDASATPTYPQPYQTTSDITLQFENSYSMKANSHPHEYLEVQTEFPEGYNQSSDPGDEDSPGLGLPIPFAPVISSIMVMAMVVYRRRS